MKNALRDLTQNDIADLMVERLIDRAEIVDSHDKETTAASSLTCLLQSLAQILNELITVEKSRHGIRRVAASKLADRPDEKIRCSILGSADLSLQTQP